MSKAGVRASSTEERGKQNRRDKTIERNKTKKRISPKKKKTKKKKKSKTFNRIMDEIRCRLVKFNFEVENSEFPVPGDKGGNGGGDSLGGLFPPVCQQLIPSEIEKLRNRLGKKKRMRWWDQEHNMCKVG